jgi:hypothetical protein
MSTFRFDRTVFTSVSVAWEFRGIIYNTFTRATKHQREATSQHQGGCLKGIDVLLAIISNICGPLQGYFVQVILQMTDL